MLNVGTISYGAGGLFFLALTLVLLTGKPGGQRKRLLLFAATASTLWMGFAATHSAGRQVFLSAQLLELLRDFAWLAFLSGILASIHTRPEQAERRFRRLASLSGAAILLLVSVTTYRFFSGRPFASSLGIDWLLAGYLAVAIFGLVLVEQLFRNTRADARRGEAQQAFLYAGTEGGTVLVAIDVGQEHHRLLFLPRLRHARDQCGAGTTRGQFRQGMSSGTGDLPEEIGADQGQEPAQYPVSASPASQRVARQHQKDRIDHRISPRIRRLERYGFNLIKTEGL